MVSSYDSDLYILAFDHRGTLQRGLFGIDGRLPTPEEVDDIAAAKRLIFDAFLDARQTIGDPSGLALLVDEQFGSAIAEEAKDRGLVFAIAAEKSGSDEFAFEYEPFGAHIEHFGPSYVKALVRYNPGGDADVNQRQAARLRELSDWLRPRACGLLLEVVVPALAHQVQAAGGDIAAFERDIRPTLMRQALLELQDSSVEPDIWKIEGLDNAADCESIVDAARRDGRTHVNCVVLGRGADDQTVERWLVTAAPVEGYRGFAIGRTIWWLLLESHLRGETSRQDAVDAIAGRYVSLVERYRDAAGRSE